MTINYSNPGKNVVSNRNHTNIFPSNCKASTTNCRMELKLKKVILIIKIDP
jgi:hypothetical protein